MTRINEFLQERRHDRLRAKAEQMFSERSFLEAYEGLFYTTTFGRFVLPVISVVTGGFFLSQLIGISPYFSLPLSGALMVGYEVVKMRLLKSGFQAYYSESPSYPVLIVLAVLLAAGSCLMSVRGAGELYKAQDDRAAIIRHDYKAKMDSVGTKIAALEALKPKRWGGLLSKSENQMILNYQDELGNLRKDLDKEEAAILESGAFNYTVITCIAAVIEVMILLSAWFFVYYHYLCFFESALQEETPAETPRPTKMVSNREEREEAIRAAIQKGNVKSPELMKNFRLNVQQARYYLNKYALAS